MQKYSSYGVIYFTPDKKNFQIIHPSKYFSGDWKGLIDTITLSGNTKQPEDKNYHSFEICPVV